MEKNKLMDVVDITNLEVENLNKVFNNSPPACLLYILKALSENKKNLTVLEKKINLGNNLLVKVTDQASILKIDKEKEGFEAQKKKLSILIGKLKYIKSSIEDFHLFFIFIGRFYTLAIKKENFESPGKKNLSKLIAKLKAEEEDLYNEYIDGNCFSKVRLALSLEPYESYFKEYTKNFFENIQYSSDPYVNTLLILKAVFYECNYFYIDTFNLTDIKFFLSRNIPINIPLPEDNNELVVLRCFFFYELLFNFLKLKPIKNNLEHLKKAVTLDLKIVNYKANTKDSLLFGLNDLQEALQKINKKHNEYLERKAIEDKQADVNHALIFYKILEGEIQTINKKTKDLIDNKYVKLEKMQRLLEIIVNESHLPKFLEVFNAKIGNDFLLNTIGKPDDIETNKEALNYLFHAICRDEFYTPLNQRITSFINEQIGNHSKYDVSILENIEFEDLIEFSFYYLFTLHYTDFNASLIGFNNKLLYTEMVTFNVFINFKLKSLEVLEKTINIRIKKFVEITFKNITEYNQHKKNTLEEIKLFLETIQDIKRILSDTKTLETSLLSKLATSSVPMPEKTLLVDSFKSLEKKQKIYEVEYQKIEKHKFINKSKSEKISKNKNARFKEKLEIENNKSIQVFVDTLSTLSKNLSESLNCIKESTQDVRRSRQKISSAMGQITPSIQKLSSNLSGLKNADEMQDFTKVSLPKLLEIVEKLIINNDLINKKDYKKKLIELHKQHVRSCSLIEDLINQVNPIINQYRKYHSEVKPQINGNLSNNYIRLKEQLSWLEKLISLIKCDADDRVINLYLIIEHADSYEKSCKVLSEEKKIQDYINEKKSEDDYKKVVILHSNQSIEEQVEKNPVRNLSKEQSEKFVPSVENFLWSQGANTNNCSEHCSATEVVRWTDECNKLKTRLEIAEANKRQSKADLKKNTTKSRYDFFISHIDPFNIDSNQLSQPEGSCLSDPAIVQAGPIETNACNNTQLCPVVYSAQDQVMFFPYVPPIIVVDTYQHINRTIYHPL